METSSARQLHPPQDRSVGAAFVDGAIRDIGEARISILDFGFLRSDACQDTISVWSGRFFCLEEHLRRFRRSCAALRLDCPLADRELTGILAALVRRTGLREAYVQMIMLRGRPEPGSRDIRTCRTHFAAFCIPYVHIVPDGGRGALEVVVSRRPRISAASVPSDIKNYHWIDFELALLEAYDRGGNTVVLTDGCDHVTEGPGFNVFVVENNRIATPRDNVLEGITRGIVLELAGELGIDAAQRAIHCDELRAADEIFITSTAGGIMPVRSLDGVDLPGASAPPLTTGLSQLYWSRRAEGWRGTAIDYAVPGSPVAAAG